MSKLSSHERKDKVKWIITAIAFVLAFIMLAGILMQQLLPEGKKPSDWFEQTTPGEQEQTTAGNTIITTDKSNSIKLMTASISPEDYADYGISTLADSAFTLTATITPEDATNKEVDYTTAWKNAQSTWAQGKSVEDYLTINQESDGSLKATGTVLNAFAEPIEITVTSRSNSKVSATCQIDYVKKITEYSVVGATSVTTTKYKDVDLALNIQYSEGTVTPEIEITVRAKYVPAGQVNLDDIYVLSTECEHGQGLGEVPINTVLYEYSEMAPSTSTSEYIISDSSFTSIMWSDFIVADCGCPSSKWGTSVVNQVKNIIYEAFKTPAKVAEWEISYQSTYNGSTYGSGAVSVNQLYDASDEVVLVSGLQFDKTHIYV